jgi:LysR family transcriptional regulator, mexEF-oprN operon transcriptional activator
MDERSYRGIDLNLLLVFAVLMRERSTTSAAKCLCLSQSTVSHSLGRLRAITNDKLFFRDKHGVTPTPRAERLYNDILPSLRTIEHALKNKDAFDPKKSDRHFKIRLRSIHSVCLVPELLRCVQKIAPNITISVMIAGDDIDLTEVLLQNSCDLAITSDDAEVPAQSWHRQIELPPSPIMCIFDGRKLDIKTPIGIDDYVRLPHVAPLFSIDRMTKIDAALVALGRTRHCVLVTNDYAGIPFYLMKAKVIANLPLHAAQLLAPVFGLTLSQLPFTTLPYCSAMHWHAKNDGDLGHLWLRQIIMEVVGLASRPRKPN